MMDQKDVPVNVSWEAAHKETGRQPYASLPMVQAGPIALQDVQFVQT